MSRRAKTTTKTAPARPTGGLRVGYYRRASTDEANQPYSLDAQKQRLDAYLATQEDWRFAADYVERASGKDVDGRPQLKRLLADAALGKLDVVVVARIDRWSRSLVDLLDTVETLDQHGVAFHSATEHFDTATPMGRLLLQMLGMFAEFERSMIIDRIQRGNAAKIALGIPLTSRVGYGLGVDTATGRIISDADTIGIVERIFDEYVNDKRGTKVIATGLNDDGIPGPGSAPWSADSVSRVLRNRRFIGELLHRSMWLPGAHDPVIDIDLFNAAQGILDLRAGDAAAAARARRNDFLLTATIRCGHCGGAYVGTSGTARNGTSVRYYSCGTKRRYGAKQCVGASVPAAELEHLITDQLLDVYSDNALFDDAIAAHLQRHAQRQEPVGNELAAVTKAIADKARVLNRYRDDYEAGRLSAERYEDRAAELDDELLSLRARAAELDLALQTPDLPTSPDPEQLSQLRSLLQVGVREGDVAVRRALFTALIESIVVNDLDDIQPTYRLYDPHATINLASADDAATDNEGSRELATAGGRFADRQSGWSQGDSNP